MENYKNLSGDSEVAGYEVGIDSLTVHFHNGSVYLYSYEKPGRSDVEHMKKLAAAGQGLNSYINRVVQTNYATKLK
jgi:hypothetical protein